MHKLSVIIPAYNAEKYLGDAIASVRKQMPELLKEIIVVDDGSVDGTFSTAVELADVVLKKEHKGAAAARNAGLKESSGDLILFLDADDVMTADSIDSLLRELEENAAVFGKAMDFISPELTEQQKAGLSPRLGSYEGVLPGCAIFTKHVFDELGGFDEKLKGGETVAWMMKLKDSVLPVKKTDVVSLCRRLHLTNTGRVFRQQEMKNYAALLRSRMKK